MDDLPSIDPQVYTFCIENSIIGPSRLETLRQVVENTPNIKVFRMSRCCFIDESGAIDFCRMFRKSRIQFIAITSTYLYEEALFCLSTSIQEMSLRSLELNGVGMVEQGARRLASAIGHCYLLHNLSLKNNNFGSVGLDALAEALPKTCIDRLDLSGNFVRSYSAGLLLSFPPPHSSGTAIRTLKLTSTQLSQTGFNKLCACIRKYATALEVLDVEGNNLTNVAKLIPILKTSKTLKKLTLSHNNIRSDLREFNVALEQNTTLTTLMLDRNPGLNDRMGRDILSTVLRNHMSLQVINVESTGMSQGIKELIKKRLEILSSSKTKILVALCTGKHPRLRTRSVFGNKMPVDLIRLIGDFL